jgi:hypothetical protein
MPRTKVRRPISYRNLVNELRSLQNRLKERIREAAPRAKQKINLNLKQLKTYEKGLRASCRPRHEADFVNLGFNVPFTNGHTGVPVKRSRVRRRARR